jgi:hypothetical protein
MTKAYTKRTRAQYPFVVTPLGEGWQILFVRTERPFRVAEFDEREEAFGHMRSLNRDWWAELHAATETRLLLLRVQEKAASRPSGADRASVWQRLKAVLHLPWRNLRARYTGDPSPDRRDRK